MANGVLAASGRPPTKKQMLANGRKAWALVCAETVKEIQQSTIENAV